MDEKTAKIIVRRLIDRMVEADGGLWRLESHISQDEYSALCDLVTTSDVAIPSGDGESEGRHEDPQPTIEHVDPVRTTMKPVLLSNQEIDDSQSIESISITDSDNSKYTNKESYDYLNYRLCQFMVPDEYRAIIELLQREVGDRVTIGELVSISDAEYLKLPYVGVAKLSAIRKLQQEILSGKYMVDVKDSDNDKLSIDNNGDSILADDINIDDFEALILNGVDRYVASLNDNNRYIFVNRHGWKTPKLSLDDTGKSLPGGAVTRERTRQLQKKVDHNLLAEMAVSPKSLWLSIKSDLSLLGRPLYPKLRACFDSDSNFYKFLELCCNADPGKIICVTQPEVKNNILDEYWVTNTSPARVDDVSEYLQSEYGLEHAVADNSIIMLRERGVIELEADGVTPKNLIKSVAYAHALLFFPDGEDWQVIQSKINDLGVSRSDVTLSRLDHGASVAVDSGWAYQSGRGTYRNIVFLDLSESDIERTLIDLRERLEVLKLEGRNAINLSVDFYDSSLRDLEYYVVRHIAKTYGERERIFFNGKSGADTVSLDQEFTLESGKKAILDMFVRSDEPLSKQMIADAIRSKSVGHATYYLELLIKEGRIVRIENNAYALSEKVFSSVDIPLIVKCAARHIESQTGAVEANKLQRYINRECDLEFNKYFYLSLLKMHAVDYGYSWVITREAVSNGRAVSA